MYSPTVSWLMVNASRFGCILLAACRRIIIQFNGSQSCRQMWWYAKHVVCICVHQIEVLAEVEGCQPACWQEPCCQYWWACFGYSSAAVHVDALHCLCCSARLELSRQCADCLNPGTFPQCKQKIDWFSSPECNSIAVDLLS